jgi:hypothetical protein
LDAGEGLQSIRSASRNPDRGRQNIRHYYVSTDSGTGADTARLVRFSTSLRILECHRGGRARAHSRDAALALDSVTDVLARFPSFRDRSRNIRGDIRCRSEPPESQRRRNTQQKMSYLFKTTTLFV